MVEPSSVGLPRRRADAERSVSAILEAAVATLGERPGASMEQIARAAGVSRQTVYAHYASREALVRAVMERSLGEAVAAMDALELQSGPAVEALDRLVRAGWGTLERYPRLMDLRVGLSPEKERDLHRPILERLERLIKRGQRSGEFDRTLPANWLLTAFIALSHAAAEEVGAGRMTADAALDVLRRSVLRVFGAEEPRV